MTFNHTIKSPMRNATSAGSTTAATNNSYRASVPISVYRELAAELEAAQTMLGFLNTQNQQLTKQNQQLRQEVEKVVGSALHMQQVATSFQPTGNNEFYYAPPEPQPQVLTEVRIEPSPTPTVRRSRPAVSVPPVEVPPPAPKAEPAPVVSEKLYTEQEEGRNRRPSHPESASDVNGMWLVTAIFLIVLTAFGVGFLVVRPFLNSR